MPANDRSVTSFRFQPPHLVSVQVDTLIRRRLEPLVLLDEHHANRPGTSDRQQRESSRCTESNSVSRLVGVWPEVSAVDVSDLASDVRHRQHDSFLLFRLAEGRRCPTDDDGVDGIGAHGENEAGNVSTRCVHRAGSDDESDNGD